MRSLKSVMTAVLISVLPLSYAKSEDLDSTDFESSAANVFKVDENNSYSDNLVLRENRKVGLALSAGGTLGVYGLNVEVNFEDINGVVLGIGGGNGYNTVNTAWKHVFLGDTIAPYTTLGFSHWYSTGGRGNFKNSSVLERVLSDNQKSQGQFTTDFVSGSVGLQYIQLTGNLAGASLFAEIVLLGNIQDPTLVPTGAVGAGYYF